MADITVNQLTTQTFYQIPQIFFSRIKHEDGKKGYIKYTSSYVSLSSDAKLAYGALYNRCLLSIKSYRDGDRMYVDENGSVFLIFTVKDLMLFLDKSKGTVIKIKKELQAHDLLREVRLGVNKANRLYLQLVNADLEVQEFYDENDTLIKKLDTTGKVIYQNPDFSKKEGLNLDNSGSSKFGLPKIEPQEVQNLDPSKKESSNSFDNDTNRYKKDDSLSTLSNSEAFKMGQHGFLTEDMVDLLSLFGNEAKELENKIYQAKRYVEKEYAQKLLGEQESILAEVWLIDLKKEIEKLIFKVKTGQNEGKPIRNVPGYFYKMMVQFWKMAILIEVQVGFIALTNQFHYAKKYPQECPSVIHYYYPEKITTTKLNQYLEELSNSTEGNNEG